MFFEHLGLQEGIARVILGATEKEGPAILRQGRRIDGEQDQVAVLTEGVDQWSFFQFTGDSDDLTGISPLTWNAETCAGDPGILWRR